MSKSVQLHDPETRETVAVEPGTQALRVYDVNGGGGGGGGGTEFAEDTAHTTGALGTLTLAVRNDAGTSLVDADGDYASLQVDSTGALRTAVSFPSSLSVDDGGGSLTVDGTVGVSGTVDVDITAQSVGNLTVEIAAQSADVEVVQPTHDDLNANANIQVGNTDVGAGNPVPISDNGGSLTVDGTVGVSGTVDVSGSTVTIQEPLSIDDNGGSITVDGTVSISGTVAATQSGFWAVGIGPTVVPGTGTTNLGKAEDAAHSSGSTGVMVLAVRNDAGAALAGTTGDYIPFSTDSVGRLRVTVGNTGFLQDAAAGATAAVFPAGFERTDTLATITPAVGDYARGRVSNRGAVWVKDGGPQRTGPTQVFSSQVFNATTSANSSTFDVTNARYLNIYFSLSESGSATDIRLIAQFSNDGGTTWFNWLVDQWVDLRYVPAQMSLQEVIPLNYVVGTLFRLRGEAQGTDGSNTITLSAWVEAIS